MDRCIWRLGMPDPDVCMRNANILKRTLLSLEYRTGATTVGDMLQLDLDDLLQRHEDFESHWARASRHALLPEWRQRLQRRDVFDVVRVRSDIV